MEVYRRLAIAILSCILLTPHAQVAASKAARSAQPVHVTPHESTVLTSTRTGTAFKTTSSDSFCLYGGSGSLLGKFQTANGGPDSQGWVSRDATDHPTLWQASTFNSPTETTSMWAGQSDAQQPGWATAPGYGNAWYALLFFRTTVSDPSAAQTVALDFVFNHDTEENYDFFSVHYDSAGVQKELLSLDGSNRNLSEAFVPTRFSDHQLRPIAFAGNDYAGPGNDEIVLTMRVASDGAWSDEDGKFDSDGAAQVDSITVTHLDGTDFEDFEGAPAGFLWKPEKAPYAGNFGGVFRLATDLDVCRSNPTFGLGFLDDGNGPYNPDYTGTGTGGTTSANWNYGDPAGWVINYNGGVSLGLIDLDNEWWSPQIDWDLPGTTADDGPNVAGAKLRFSVWVHLPILNGMYYQWSVRGHDPVEGWSVWDNYGSVSAVGGPEWRNESWDVTGLIPANKDRVQIQLSLRDLAQLFAYPGNDATPSPLFDNVSFLKYEIGGPAISSRTVDLFQDSFSQGGLSNVSTEAARDLLDIRIDMARDINSGVNLNVPGDSIVVDVSSRLPGVGISDSLNQITMHYSLNMNPLFESSVRGYAPVNDVASGMYGWDQHEGSISASQAITSSGAHLTGRYFFDLPDADFMYPGDVLEYYIRAEDDDGNLSTLPVDLTGFDSTAAPYDRTFTMRGLPSYRSPGGAQPEILLWNDFGRRGSQTTALAAFGQLGMSEGDHFDSYTTMGPSSGVGNGLGSGGAHGASLQQLSGYTCIFYDVGNLSWTVMSDGSGIGGNDKGDDIGLLTSWWNEPAEFRAIAHFGDNLASSLVASAAGQAYLANVIHATLVQSDVRAQLGGQTAPAVHPTAAISFFETEFVAYGGCLSINRFDWVDAGSGALVSHEFMDVTGTLPLAAAGIYNAVTDTDGADRRSLLFPFGLDYVSSASNKLPGTASTAAKLFEEILEAFGGGHLIIPIPIGVPDRPERAFDLHASYPNPFNPQTTLAFTLGRDARGRVDIYDLRGAHVRTLARGGFTAGRNELKWLGKDDRGAGVSSGVYLVRYAIDGYEKSQKVVLIE